MALAVLDGNQSATTLSSVVTGGEHIVAHSVVSLGSNAISNITTAVSGSVVTIPNLNVLARSVATDGVADSTLNFVKIGGHQDGSNQTAHIVHVSGGGAMKVDASDSTVTFGAISGTVTIGNTVTIAGTVTANPTGTQIVAGTVTANVAGNLNDTIEFYDESNPQYVVGVHIKDLAGNVIGTSVAPMPISGTVTIGSALPTGTNRIGVVTIGGGTVTIGAGTAQIGSVTASLQASSITGGLKSLTYQDIASVAYLNTAIGSLPALAAGTAQIGSVTASISGTVPISISSVTVGNSVTIGSLPAISGTVTANTFAVQGTAVTTSNFTSTTPSTVLASFNATREVLTIFNEGAGNLHICAGATCTTIAYQVRLSAGDYYEVPNHQTTITHSAVFATAGTARVCQVS
jgi:hypothetical protein